MKIKIITCGKIKDKSLDLLIKDYEKKISSYVNLESIVLDDLSIPKNASKAEEDNVKEKEGLRILEKIKADEYVIACDLNAEEMDSVEFSSYLYSLGLKSVKIVTFIIGGSLGISDAIRQRSNMRLSFSKMTFTHQMSRYILLEQIYRAYKIINHETYHK